MRGAEGITGPRDRPDWKKQNVIYEYLLVDDGSHP